MLTKGVGMIVQENTGMDDRMIRQFQFRISWLGREWVCLANLLEPCVHILT